MQRDWNTNKTVLFRCVYSKVISLRCIFGCIWMYSSSYRGDHDAVNINEPLNLRPKSSAVDLGHNSDPPFCSLDTANTAADPIKEDPTISEWHIPPQKEHSSPV